MATQRKKEGDNDVLAHLQRVKEVFPRIAHKVGKDLDEKVLDGLIVRFQGAIAAKTRVDAERRSIVETKGAARRAAKAYAKRLRLVVKGTFGDDSTEYAAVGGTRVSNQKTTPRAPETAKAVKTG